jgi:hypothetical protein
MKSHRILPAALLLCTLAACSQAPTGSDPEAQPGGASFDGGGFTIGSGRNTEEPGDSTTTPTDSAEGTTERSGGYGMGSGN